MKKTSIFLLLSILLLTTAIAFPWESNNNGVSLSNTSDRVSIGTMNSTYALTISGGVQDTGIYMYNKADIRIKISRNMGRIWNNIP